MYSVGFYVVTAIVIGVGGLYALWYARRHGRQE